MSSHDDLIRYYQNELTYLRQMGQSFSRRYPKLAGRLELAPDSCTDPHVERLIESFAYLTARLQMQMHAELPQVTSSLLSVLYPHLVNPIPPATIAEFVVDPKQGKMTTGHLIPAQTPVFAQTDEGLTCRFRTCYPTELWPLEVSEAGIESKDRYSDLDFKSEVASLLRLRVRTLATPIRELQLSKLRFFINGEPGLIATLYELLFCHGIGVAVVPEGSNSASFLPKDALTPVGFKLDEEVIPYPANAHPGYRLLQEFFGFPLKFQFFDVAGLNPGPSSKYFDILLLFDTSPTRRLSLTPANFRLGCSPVVNLFQKTSEPIRIDHRRSEYLLVPDIRRERTTEIHSIVSVSASANPAEESQELEPFFSVRHRGDDTQTQAFWHARREWSQRENDSGTDMFLSFVDLAFNPRNPPMTTAYAHTLCTNRDFSSQLRSGSLFQMDQPAPIKQIVCLHAPTPTSYPPLSGHSLWALVSNLSLNYLSLSQGPHSVDALKEMLRLYSLSDRLSTRHQVDGIRELICKPVVRRIGTDAWRGYCQGTEVSLTLDETMYVGSSPVLFAWVLSHFFALYASLNSFTELVLKSYQREGEWKRFPAMAGVRALL